MADTNYYVDGDAGSDSNNGLTAGTAKLTIQAGLNLCTAAGDICNVLRRAANATYDLTAGLTTPAGPSYSHVTRLRGYGATIGDGVKALVRATAGSLTMFTSSGQGWLVEDMEFDGDSQTAVRGVSLDSLSHGLADCTIRRCTNSAASLVCSAVRCWFKDCTTQPAVIGNLIRLYGCALTGNTAGGFYANNHTGSVSRCLFAGNTGATSDGIQTYYALAVIGNVFYGNGRHGLQVMFYPGADGPFLSNIFVLNGGRGLAFPANSHGAAAVPTYDFNAFGQGTQGNTSGARLNITAGANDVMLTADVDPFADATNWATKTTLADLFAAFAPNATAGGGALLRAAGFPLYLDVGAVQHQDAGGGGGSVFPVIGGGGLVL